jgi:serine/threonine protein kinase
MGGWLSLLFTPSSKKIKFKEKNLVIQQKLGEGAFSYVYLVKDPSDGKQYAAKKTLCQTEEIMQVNASVQTNNFSLHNAKSRL